MFVTVEMISLAAFATTDLTASQTPWTMAVMLFQRLENHAENGAHTAWTTPQAAVAAVEMVCHTGVAASERPDQMPDRKSLAPPHTAAMTFHAVVATVEITFHTGVAIAET
jgi:hypothetical protein